MMARAVRICARKSLLSLSLHPRAVALRPALGLPAMSSDDSDVPLARPKAKAAPAKAKANGGANGSSSKQKARKAPASDVSMSDAELVGAPLR
jgi:hypothetical protein